MSSKKFVKITISLIIVLLLLIMSFVIVIDPFFQYHKPLNGLSYNIDEPRYHNAGLLKSFEYNSIITGTSMTQNFKVSEANLLFNENFIKTSLNGANYEDINKLLEVAFNENKEIKNVIRGLDYSKLYSEAIYIYDEKLPLYLYDNNLINDVYYFFNIDVLKKCIKDVLMYTMNGNKTTVMDEYDSWYAITGILPNAEHYNVFIFSKENVLNSYKRAEISNKEKYLTQTQKNEVIININNNVINIAKENPQTTFYIFFPPYSVSYWDNQIREGRFYSVLEAKYIAVEEMLKQDNIKLFSFESEKKIITDLNNYTDQAHYSEKINSLLLKYMSEDEYLLTKDNYEDIFKKDEEFLLNYNYDAIYE